MKLYAILISSLHYEANGGGGAVDLDDKVLSAGVGLFDLAAYIGSKLCKAYGGSGAGVADLDVAVSLDDGKAALGVDAVACEIIGCGAGCGPRESAALL